MLTEGLIKQHEHDNCLALTQMGFTPAFLQACENMAEYATSASESEAKKWRKQHTKEYCEDLAKDIAIGNARAHRLTKPFSYAPPIAVETSRGLSTMPSDILADQEKMWSKWWQVDPNDKQAQPTHRDLQGKARQPSSIKELRDAAKSFAAGTSRSDGWQPRQIAALCDEAIRALSALLHLAERSGNFPTSMQSCMVVLISKPCGGLRPVPRRLQALLAD